MDSAVETAYQLGLSDGVIHPSNFNVVYTLQHTHGTYCYPLANMQNGYKTNPTHDDTTDTGAHITVVEHHYYVQCSACGRWFHGNGGGRDEGHGGESSSLNAAAKSNAENAFYAHLTDGRCTANGYQCGKDDSLQEVTDISLIGEGDSVISATISFQ